jgi:hypothetical protein
VKLTKLEQAAKRRTALADAAKSNSSAAGHALEEAKKRFREAKADLKRAKKRAKQAKRAARGAKMQAKAATAALSKAQRRADKKRKARDERGERKRRPLPKAARRPERATASEPTSAETSLAEPAAGDGPPRVEQLIVKSHPANRLVTCRPLESQHSGDRSLKANRRGKSHPVAPLRSRRPSA